MYIRITNDGGVMHPHSREINPIFANEINELTNTIVVENKDILSDTHTITIAKNHESKPWFCQRFIHIPLQLLSQKQAMYSIIRLLKKDNFGIWVYNDHGVMSKGYHFCKIFQIIMFSEGNSSTDMSDISYLDCDCLNKLTAIRALSKIYDMIFFRPFESHALYPVKLDTDFNNQKSLSTDMYLLSDIITFNDPESPKCSTDAFINFISYLKKFIAEDPSFTKVAIIDIDYDNLSIEKLVYETIKCQLYFDFNMTIEYSTPFFIN